MGPIFSRHVWLQLEHFPARHLALPVSVNRLIAADSRPAAKIMTDGCAKERLSHFHTYNPLSQRSSYDRGNRLPIGRTRLDECGMILVVVFTGWHQTDI